MVTIAKPAGLNDKLPAVAYAAKKVKTRLQDCMEAFGYRLVETPVVEYSELFLRKSGEEFVNRLFTFERRDKTLCLRPEFSASIGRLFVEHLQHMPKPIRVQFAGPVFRYESPRRSRSRQFTIVGAELIGASGGIADAEIIALACEGLKWVGISDYKLVVGHIGVVNQFLKRLNLDQRARRFVISHMESLRKPEKGKAYVREQLESLYSEPAEKIKGPREEFAEFYPADQQPVDQLSDVEHEINLVLDMMLRSREAVLKTSRSKEEIAERLLLKLRRADEVPLIGHAIDFAERLGQIKGPPSEVFQEAESLLDAYELDKVLLKDPKNMAELLACYGVPDQNIVVDMGLSRGVHYYTGMVFEIHTSPMKADSQLCGGGRYDDLLRILGSRQDTPAAGFAYGLERIVEELERLKGEPTTWEQRTDVLVVPVSQQEVGYAIEVAQYLRKQLHLSVQLNVEVTRSLGNTLKYADRYRIPYVIILGTEEKNQSAITVRKMLEREQISVPFNQLAHSTVFSRRTHAKKNLPV